MRGVGVCAHSKGKIMRLHRRAHQVVSGSQMTARLLQLTSRSSLGPDVRITRCAIDRNVLTTSSLDSSGSFPGLPGSARNKMSSIERPPTSVPFGAITGSRRILASLIFCNAIWISSSGAQEYSLPDMTSPTLTSPARQFRVPKSDTDVTVRDHANDLSVSRLDRQESTICIPHQLCCRAEVVFWLAVVWSIHHYVSHFHGRPPLLRHAHSVHSFHFSFLLLG